MKTLKNILGLAIIFTTTTFGATIKSQTIDEKCQLAADTVIRRTIENFGLTKDEYDFQIEEVEQVGKNYDGSPIMYYSTNLIIAEDGFYPGARADVTLVVSDNECHISQVSVDLNIAKPGEIEDSVLLSK